MHFLNELDISTRWKFFSSREVTDLNFYYIIWFYSIYFHCSLAGNCIELPVLQVLVPTCLQRSTEMVVEHLTGSLREVVADKNFFPGISLFFMHPFKVRWGQFDWGKWFESNFISQESDPIFCGMHLLFFLSYYFLTLPRSGDVKYP